MVIDAFWVSEFAHKILKEMKELHEKQFFKPNKTKSLFLKRMNCQYLSSFNMEQQERPSNSNAMLVMEGAFRVIMITPEGPISGN